MNMYGHARSLNKPCLRSHVSDNRFGEGEWEREEWASGRGLDGRI